MKKIKEIKKIKKSSSPDEEAFNRKLKEWNELEAAELKRRKVIKSKVMLFDGPATESENGQCFSCLTERALPGQAYCKECLQEVLSLKCICCGSRLYVLDEMGGTLEEDSPDGDFCYRCLHQMS
jgi:hypothetical protein